MSYLIPEGTICLFLYCCTLLLISNIYSAHRINLGTCKLTSLQDTNLYLVYIKTWGINNKSCIELKSEFNLWMLKPWEEMLAWKKAAT